METERLFLTLLTKDRPDAIATVRGTAAYSAITGIVRFFALPEAGLLIAAEITDLPDQGDEDTPSFFAFHIHENGDCSENLENTGNHYNPEHVPHPQHAGDLPPLLSNDGYVWNVFYDSYLTIPMILNRSVIIHSAPDDFKTQPSGNSGAKIACGIIRKPDAETW